VPLQEPVGRFLEIQRIACALGRTRFEEDRPVFSSCSAAFGLVERMYELARA
jgi:hypothetical protein